MIFLLLLFLSFTVNSCTSNITYLRYNEYSDAWEFTTHRDTLKNPDWRALRSGEDNSKINSSEEAEAIKEIYNSRFLKVPAELAIFYALSGEISHPYLSGKKYFKGMDYYKKRQFKDAVREFEGAKLIDGNLKYLSDVDYLIGLSYDALDMDYLANQYFNDFYTYSESVCPFSFNLDENIRVDYDSLIFNKELPESHFSNKYKGPKLKIRNFPGYISPKKNSMAVFFSFYYDNWMDFNITGLHLRGRFTGKSQFEVFASKNYEYIEYSYQIYKNTSNTFAILPLLRVSTNTIRYANDINIKYEQINPGIEIAYFPHPKIGFYTGYNYYVYNENNKLTVVKNSFVYTVWEPNIFYAGARFYLFDNIGVAAEINSENILRIGIELVPFGVLWY